MILLAELSRSEIFNWKFNIGEDCDHEVAVKVDEGAGGKERVGCRRSLGGGRWEMLPSDQKESPLSPTRVRSCPIWVTTTQPLASSPHHLLQPPPLPDLP